MQIAVIKRYSRGFTITSNYTLSKVEGDFGDATHPVRPTAGSGDCSGGPLDQDHRHRFTTSWVLDLPGADMET